MVVAVAAMGKLAVYLFGAGRRAPRYGGAEMVNNRKNGQQQEPSAEVKCIISVVVICGMWNVDDSCKLQCKL